MTVDHQGLQSTIDVLEEQVARLRRIAKVAAAGESVTLADGGLAGVGLNLPPEVVVPRPEAVAAYLRAHPDVIDVVRDLSVALVQEFRNEPSEIELALYQDPEIDDRYLVFYVRLSEYDESLMPRIDTVIRPFDDRRSKTDGWVLVTTDYEPAG